MSGFVRTVTVWEAALFGQLKSWARSGNVPEIGVRTVAVTVWEPGLAGVHVTWIVIVCPRARKNTLAPGAVAQPESSETTRDAPFASFVPSFRIVTSTAVGFPWIAEAIPMSARLTLRSGQTNSRAGAELMLFRSFSSRNAPGSRGSVWGASTTTDTWTVVSATPPGVHVTHASRVDASGTSAIVKSPIHRPAETYVALPASMRPSPFRSTFVLKKLTTAFRTEILPVLFTIAVTLIGWFRGSNG